MSRSQHISGRILPNLSTQPRDTAAPVVDTSKQSTGRNKRSRNTCLLIVTVGIALGLVLVCSVAAILEQFPWQSRIHQAMLVDSPICGTWQADTVQRVNLGGLEAVAVVSPTDIWAVGSTHDLVAYLPLIEHWDGKTWRSVDAPGPRSRLTASLYGIAAISANDIWAVGDVDYDTSGNFASRSFIEHWDGVQWSTVPSPNPGADSNHLNGVVAIAPDNVWAVGGYQSQASSAWRALVLHWDGTKWKDIANLPTARDAELAAVTAIGPDNIWAVGSYRNAYINGLRTLVMHWDGALWSVVPSPSETSSTTSSKASSITSTMTYSNLNDVAATSPDDVWAVGSYRTSTQKQNQTLLLHWDGKVWDHIPSPSGSLKHHNNLFSLAVVSKNDVWAVGNQIVMRGWWGTEPLILHWDGLQWSLVPSPRPQDFQSLRSVVPVSQDEVLAVGMAQNEDRAQNALVARFRKSPCATPSSTTGTSTGEP